MSTWRKVGCCLIAAVCGVLFARAEIPEPPDTVWTVTEPSGGAPAYIEDASGWKFSISSSGELRIEAFDDQAQLASRLNFRTVPEMACGYQIKRIPNQGFAAAAGHGWTTPLRAKFREVVRETYWPASLEYIGQYAFYTVAELEVFDLPEDSRLKTVDQNAFNGCAALKSFKLHEGIETLAGGAFGGCASLVFSGPTLPNSVTNGPSLSVSSGIALPDGLLVIGGGDDADIKWSSPASDNRYFIYLNITNLIYGAKVTDAGVGVYSPFHYIRGDITNIVIRYTGTFNLGNTISAAAVGTTHHWSNWDISGWVKGNLRRGDIYKSRIVAAKNLAWLAWYKSPDTFVPWASLTAGLKQTYWDTFNGGVVGTGDEVPVGLTKKVTFNEMYTPEDMWVVFKPGDWPVQTLVVSSNQGEQSAEPSETAAFSPAFGSTEDIVAVFGKSFACTAPRYTVSEDGQTLGEVVGYALYRRDATGETTVLVEEDTFSGDEERTLTFDTEVWTEAVYRLEWRIETAGYKVSIKPPRLKGLGTWSIAPEAPLRGFYPSNATVTVTAVPAAGHPFVQWTDRSGHVEPVTTAVAEYVLSSPLLLEPKFYSDFEFPEPPDTVWTVTEPASKNALAYIEDASGWKFSISSSGEINIAAYADTDQLATKLNFRTVPELTCGYQIKRIPNYSFAAKENHGWTTPLKAKFREVVRETFWPASLEYIGQYAFYSVAELEVFDLPEDSRLTTIDTQAFSEASSLRYFELHEGMKMVGGFSSSKMMILGPTLPNSLTNAPSLAVPGGHALPTGTLTIGGDDVSDITWNGNCSFQRLNITNLIFGAGVTKAGVSVTTWHYLTGNITNIVVRNPGVFDFNTCLSGCAPSTTQDWSQWDFAGWVTGTLRLRTAYKSRIVAPKTADWSAWKKDTQTHVPWDEVSPENQQLYWDAFNGGVVGTGDEVPFGVTKAVTYNGMTTPAGMAVVFKPGEWPKVTSLLVAGSAGDFAAEASETNSFAPAYGTVGDVKTLFGEVFDCTAPRYVVSADGLTVLETTGYELASKDEFGAYSVVESEGSFAGDVPRAVTFDLSVYENSEYRLVWRMTEVGYKITYNTPLIADLGTWSADVEPQFRGFYEKGTAVTVTAHPAGGRSVIEWTDRLGNAAPVHAASATYVMTKPLSLEAVFSSDWVFMTEGKFTFICDGYWKLLVSDNSDGKLTLNKYATYDGPRVHSYGDVLDLAKPIENGCAITNLAVEALIGIRSNVSLVRLGEEIRTVGDMVFRGNLTTNCTVEVLGQTTFGNLAFYGTQKEFKFFGLPPQYHPQGSFAQCENYKSKYFIPKGVPEWKAICRDPKQFHRWADCTPEEKDIFHANFPGEPDPYGLLLYCRRWTYWFRPHPKGMAILVR